LFRGLVVFLQHPRLAQKILEKTDEASRSAPTQGTPRALEEKNQISQAQWRTNSGAAAADNEAETVGEI
jgi:hypothetical protein